MGKFSSWNLRAHDNPSKQVEISKFIASRKMSTTMKNSFPFHWDYAHNVGSTTVPRITEVWYRLGPAVRILFSSEQMMVLAVEQDLKLFIVLWFMVSIKL